MLKELNGGFHQWTDVRRTDEDCRSSRRQLRSWIAVPQVYVHIRFPTRSMPHSIRITDVRFKVKKASLFVTMN